MSRFDGDGDDSYMPAALWDRAVENALRGKKGQAALRELEAALVGLPQKRLLESALCHEGEVCALGALALKRGVLDPTLPPPVEPLDPDHDIEAWQVAEWAGDALGLTYALAIAVQWQNDEGHWATYVQRNGQSETPEQRYERVLAWVREQLGAVAA